IHHATMPQKSLLRDVEQAIPAPYGNAITLARELSKRKTRYQAESKNINPMGLGTHVLAAADNDQGMAILVWNFYWRENPADSEFSVLVKNLPRQTYPAKIKQTVYLVDTQHNNYFLNDTQSALEAYTEELLDYHEDLTIPLTLEPAAVALILLQPE